MSAAEELRKHAARCRSAAEHMHYRFMATGLLEEADACEDAASAQEGLEAEAAWFPWMEGSGGPLHPESRAG